jgi:hypothetical protein
MQVVQGLVQISVRAWPKLRLMEDTHRQIMSKTVKNRPPVWVWLLPGVVSKLVRLWQDVPS